MPNKQYVCYRCNKLFRDNYTLQKHTERKFPCTESNKDTVCPLCEKDYCSVASLKRHIALLHPGKLPKSHATGTVRQYRQVSGHNGNRVETGRESIDEIIQAEWNKFGGVSPKRDIILSLIKYMNCSDKKPHNHNILVQVTPDTEGSASPIETAYVYKQGFWREADCGNAIRDCISNTGLKAQDALVDKQFHKYNPATKTKITACLESLEQITTFADRNDSRIADIVEEVKTTFVEFTLRHVDLLEFAIAESATAPKPRRYKPSKVFRAYEADGLRRAQLLQALQKGDSLPPLHLDELDLTKEKVI